MIDINYASRDPQIVIQQKESDDPRDKLISMFTGQSMPGVRDGYCRIERYAEVNGEVKVVITPVHPVELINHIPLIAKFAEENAACDTSGVAERYLKIIQQEGARIKVEIDGSKMKRADDWLKDNLPHPLYKRWVDEVLYDASKIFASQG